MRVDLLLPAGEKIVLVLEAIGDDPKGRPLDRPGRSALLAHSVLDGHDAEEAIQKVTEASKIGNLAHTLSTACCTC
jgi:hypothetical protein